MAPTPPSKAISIRPSRPHAERTTAITPSGEEVLVAKPALRDFFASPLFSGDESFSPVRGADHGFSPEPLLIFRPDEFSSAPTPYKTEVFESPSGLHLKPSDGTDILSLFEDHYYGMIDTIVGSPVIQKERIVINLQDWSNPPENRDQLAEDLQRLAEEHNLTIALKWRGAEGPMAREFEPASVREAQEGQVLMAAPREPDATEEKLFEAVKQNPDDDAARHVYADYLLENGDPRGELIALQLGPQTDESRARQREIEKTLIADLENETGIRVYSPDFEILKNSTFYQFEGGCLKSARLEGADATSIQTLFASRLGFRLEKLSLRPVTIDDFSKILPHLTNLRSLEVTFEKGSSLVEERRAMRKLAKALPSSAITSLSLSDNDIGDEGFIALLAGLPGSKIETLDVSSASIGDHGLRELIKILPQTKIKRLNLSDNKITDRALVGLVRILSGTSVEEVATDAATYRVVENAEGVRTVEQDAEE